MNNICISVCLSGCLSEIICLSNTVEQTCRAVYVYIYYNIPIWCHVVYICANLNQVESHMCRDWWSPTRLKKKTLPPITNSTLGLSEGSWLQLESAGATTNTLSSYQSSDGKIHCGSTCQQGFSYEVPSLLAHPQIAFNSSTASDIQCPHNIRICLPSEPP